jgi:hypothetical protein
MPIVLISHFTSHNNAPNRGKTGEGFTSEAGQHGATAGLHEIRGRKSCVKGLVKKKIISLNRVAMRLY